MSWAWPPKMLRKIWCLIGLSWSVRKDKLLSMQHVIHIPSHENSFDSLCIQKWSETIGNWHKIPWGDSIKTGRHVVSFDETGSGLWTNSFAQALEMHGDCHASQEPRCRMAMRAWETSGSIVMKVWNNFEKIHRIYDRIDRIDLCSFLVCENHTVKIKSQIQYLRLYGDMMVEACTGARTADHFFHPGFQEFGIRVVPWRSPLGTYPCHSKLLQTNLAHGEPWQQWSKVCINNKGVLTSACQPEDTSYFRKTPTEQPRSKAGKTHPTVYIELLSIYIYTCHGLIQTFPVADRHRICMCPTDMVSQLV